MLYFCTTAKTILWSREDTVVSAGYLAVVWEKSELTEAALSVSADILCFCFSGLLCSLHIFRQCSPIQSGQAHRLKIHHILSVYKRKFYLWKRLALFSTSVFMHFSTDIIPTTIYCNITPPPRPQYKRKMQYHQFW